MQGQESGMKRLAENPVDPGNCALCTNTPPAAAGSLNRLTIEGQDTHELLICDACATEFREWLEETGMHPAEIVQVMTR